jgi:phosphatidylinositol-3,4,5-trisphosphate 3-phosphatase/dual-specificity protein phosphatase PTEN
MADYVRRLVSGPKARFRDHDLNLELDLVYITPRVIIMGYPAEGFESFYRNRRADAKRFLDSRHGKNYWVFNLCPLRENGYEKEVFEGRVTRFPFPDHHAPPLALMPLVAREMHAWLDGSSERVVVIHCKGVLQRSDAVKDYGSNRLLAGKGRSGTMACTYLLTLVTEGSNSNAATQAEDALNQLPDDLDSTTHAHSSQRFSPIDRKSTADPIETKPLYDESSGLPIATSPEPMSPQTSRSATLNANPERSFTDALKGVLDLHTAKRMKPLSPAPSQTSDLVDEKEKKQKQGVSIPSQRRYLHYWALVLNGEAPKEVLNKGQNHVRHRYN